MRHLIASLTLTLILCPAPAVGQGFRHSELDSVLIRHVSTAGVDYRGLKTARAPLDRYVRQLGAVSSSEYDNWSRNEKLAYLINAYNALVLQQVIDNYPIKRSMHLKALVRPANSVWQIKGFFDDVRHPVAGASRTLDDIEHKLLREVLKEPRIHAALVCAARSCPPLRKEAYDAARIDEQLDEQWRVFINDKERNHIDRRRGEIKLSEILKWFESDFGGTDAVISFISRYVDAPTQNWLRTRKYRVLYFDYDWTLNDAAVER